jgi:hypothetical protein
MVNGNSFNSAGATGALEQDLLKTWATMEYVVGALSVPADAGSAQVFTDAGAG